MHVVTDSFDLPVEIREQRLRFLQQLFLLFLDRSFLLQQVARILFRLLLLSNLLLHLVHLSPQLGSRLILDCFSEVLVTLCS